MRIDFCSASTFPAKLFHNPIIQNGKIVPYHITIIPTNVCNKNCRECFCYKRNKKKEMSLEMFKDIVDEFYKLGTRAISLSGGGEPDCHPQINEMINYVYKKSCIFPDRIDIALVTNGENLNKITTENLNKLTWIRVSGTSSSPINLKKLEKEIERGIYVDWGLSYIESGFQLLLRQNTINDMIDFINKHSQITHLRVVSDMMHPDINLIPNLKRKVRMRNDRKVIWQERINNKKGVEKCWLSLLHPIVDVEGYIQPCCGIHFATNPPEYDFGKNTRMGFYKDYKFRIETQTPYVDSKKCVVCQYSQYNDCLEMLLNKPKHERFV